VTNLWAYGWVPGKSPVQQVGFGQPQGDCALDQVTFARAQDAYLVNLNHVPFVGAQDHYQVEHSVRYGAPFLTNGAPRAGY